MFVSHIFATTAELPPFPAGVLYQYVVGENGIFVRARRPGLEAMAWVAGSDRPIRGLTSLRPYVRLERLVPRYIIEHLFLDAWRQGPLEKLYYLKLGLSRAGQGAWTCVVPDQVQSPGGVRPVNPYAGGADTVLEVHSHHRMAAFFSGTDDRDEQSGFRLYAVVGGLGGKRPRIRARVGIYGNFWEVPASWVFDLPPYAVDGLEVAPEIEVEYDELVEAA